MASSRIEFSQTGGAPDKRACNVRWCIDEDRHSITVKHDADSNDWVTLGQIKITSVEYVDDGFCDDDKWVLVLYTTDDGQTYRLVSEGPKNVQQSYYYTVGIERQRESGKFALVDDTLTEDMPDLTRVGAV